MFISCKGISVLDFVLFNTVILSAILLPIKLPVATTVFCATVLEGKTQLCNAKSYIKNLYTKL